MCYCKGNLILIDASVNIVLFCVTQNIMKTSHSQTNNYRIDNI